MSSILARGFVISALSLAFACSLQSKPNARLTGANDSSQNDGQKNSSAREIAALVKSTLSGVSDARFRDLVRHEYMKLHLQDRNGNWLIPEAARRAEFLLPSDLKRSTITSMIDAMARNMEDNPYMMAFLDAAREKSFPVLKQRFEAEGTRVIPQAIAAAYAFEQITQAELDDPKFIEVLSDHWQDARKRAGVSLSQTGVFGIVKLLSVEHPIRKIIGFHENKKLDPGFLRGFLSLNIFEAIVADKVTKHYDNAEAGWPLYNNPASQAKANELLGTGPAKFSADGKKIEIRYAMPKQWDDLYQVWNMAFVTQIPTYPMWISKLLIPSMSGYKDRPEEYIYRRTITLYTALHYYNLAQIEDAKDGIPSVDWKDESLTKLWGEINRSSAQDYLGRVKSAK